MPELCCKTEAGIRLRLTATARQSHLEAGLYVQDAVPSARNYDLIPDLNIVARDDVRELAPPLH